MQKLIFDIFKTIFLYLIICISIFLMTKNMVQYIGFKPDAGFLKLKQEYLHITHWKIAFYIHVFTSSLCLLAGLTQFVDDFKIVNKTIHKAIGIMYVYLILFINFPAGLIMAYYANGLLPSKIAFFILDILWFWFTLKAIIEIKKGNTLAHKQYMQRSFALTFSAITLRVWNGVLINYTELIPLTRYMIIAWLGFVPNLLITEYLIWKRKI